MILLLNLIHSSFIHYNITCCCCYYYYRIFHHQNYYYLLMRTRIITILIHSFTGTTTEVNKIKNIKYLFSFSSFLLLLLLL